jgi:hypothetical protein
MRAAGVNIGDTVTVVFLGENSELRLVGEVIVNDNYETDPGRGGVVSSAWLSEVNPAAYVSDFVMRFRAGEEAAGLATLNKMFPGLVSPPLVQDEIVNLRRLSAWPALLAAMVIVMAGVAFVHLLVTSVREHRHQLAVVKALGWSRRQVGRSIFWHSSFLTLPAILIGVPAGFVLGRWGWGVIARSLGVPSEPVVPMLALVAVAALALVAANFLAILPSWQAAHIRPREALRAE